MAGEKFVVVKYYLCVRKSVFVINETSFVNHEENFKFNIGFARYRFLVFKTKYYFLTVKRTYNLKSEIVKNEIMILI